MTPQQRMKKLIELTAELEEVIGGSASFLYGDSGDDILGILVADMETTNAIMGDSTPRSDAN